jgi:hypothetical protein
VRVATRYRGIDLLRSFLEDQVVAANHPFERIGQLRAPADVRALLLQREILLVHLPAYGHEPGRAGSRQRRAHLVLNLERLRALLRRLDAHRETARDLTAAAAQAFANILLQALVECGLQQLAPRRIGRYQPDLHALEWEDLPAALYRLNPGFHLFQNRPMHQQQLVRLGRAEGLLRPLSKLALDRLFHLRKKAHCFASAR